MRYGLKKTASLVALLLNWEGAEVSLSFLMGSVPVASIEAFGATGM